MSIFNTPPSTTDPLKLLQSFQEKRDASKGGVNGIMSDSNSNTDVDDFVASTYDALNNRRMLAMEEVAEERNAVLASYTAPASASNDDTLMASLESQSEVEKLLRGILRNKRKKTESYGEVNDSVTDSTNIPGINAIPTVSDSAGKVVEGPPYNAERMIEINTAGEVVKPEVDGLMRDPRKLGGSEGYGSFNKDLKIYTDEYANVYLKKHEGFVPHKSLEGGKDTEAFGVKFSRGLKRKDFTTDASFAAAVALKHRDEAKSKFKDLEWDALPQSVRFAFTDLNFNVGTIGSTADQATMVDKMKNTLNYVGMTTKAGGKASLIALAERRAWNWNKSSGDIKQNKITKIKQIPTTTGGTTFEYLDANGDLIHSTTTTRTPVKLSKKGIATTLTKTREVTL